MPRYLGKAYHYRMTKTVEAPDADNARDTALKAHGLKGTVIESTYPEYDGDSDDVDVEELDEEEN